MYEIRRAEILKYLKRNKNITVKALSEYLQVSEMTIRRDLSKLETEGIVKRIFGGVSIATDQIISQALPVRATNMPAAKRRMAKLAEKLVQDGDSVLLDSGTTILELSKLLIKKQIKIITSSLLIAENACNSSATIHVSGGILDSKYRTLIGNTAIKFYENINCTYAFVGCGGVSLDRGITEFTEEAAAQKQAMITHSRTGVLMVDNTKFETVQMFKAAMLEDIDIVITDEKPSSEYLKFFDRNGIELLVAED